jgi:hypothetical protein
MKLTQKESIKTELRIFNYEFSKFDVLTNSVAMSRIPESSDLYPTVVAPPACLRLGLRLRLGCTLASA